MLADRGLYARWLYPSIVARGLASVAAHQSGLQVPPGGPGALRTGCASCVGRRPALAGRGTAFATPECRLACTLVAWWGDGHAEPWFVLTDLAPEEATPHWYGLRGWCEQGFKVLKRGGWQWQHTQMRDPAASGAAVAGVGGGHAVGDQRRQRPGLDRRPTPRSCRTCGRCWADAPPQPAAAAVVSPGLAVAAGAGHPWAARALPRRLVPEPWPEVPPPLRSLLPLHKRVSYAYL